MRILGSIPFVLPMIAAIYLVLHLAAAVTGAVNRMIPTIEQPAPAVTLAARQSYCEDCQ